MEQCPQTARVRSNDIDEDTIDLRRYVGVFLTYWWLLVLVPAVGGAAGYFYSQSQDPIYEAKATILVQYRGSGLVPGFSDFRRSEELASTYRRLVTANPFLEAARQNGGDALNGIDLATVISASTASNPPVLEIKARHRDPNLAAVSAQIVAEEFIDFAIEQRLSEFARLSIAAASQGIATGEDLVTAQLAAIDSLSLLEPVLTPRSPVVPRTRLNIALGAILGLVLAAAVAALLDNIRDTVRFPDQLSRRFGVEGLGSVFKWSSHDTHSASPILLTAPTSSYAEAFRQIRANLQFATANQTNKILLVASPGPQEGKSTIISNLAVALAHTGKRVITIDGDLRRPSVHQFFGTVNREPGLSNYLADLNTEVSDVIQPTEVEGVHVIPGGPSPPNPAELLGSPKMDALLQELSQRYDNVLLDSPPVLLVADASIMASQADGVIMVVDGFNTRSSSLKAALDAMRNTRVNILGVIMNKLKPARFGYGYIYPYHYYYYSNYSYYADPEQVHVNGNGKVKAYGSFTRKAKSVLGKLKRQ